MLNNLKIGGKGTAPMQIHGYSHLCNNLRDFVCIRLQRGKIGSPVDLVITGFPVLSSIIELPSLIRL